MYYQQRHKFREFGFGNVEILFIIADSFDELFEEHSPETNSVDIWDLDSVSEDLDIAEGVFAADELKLKMSAVQINSTSARDAFYFTLAASDETVRRFCAIMLNPTYTDGIVDPATVVFKGLIESAMDADDEQWKGLEYATRIDAVRTWGLTATVFDIALLDRIKISYDIVSKTWTLSLADTENSVLTETMTESDFPIFQALSWFGPGEDLGGTLGDPSAYMKLVNLHGCLNAIISKAQSLINTWLDGSYYTIDLLESDISLQVNTVKIESSKYWFLKLPIHIIENELHAISISPGETGMAINWRMVLPAYKEDRSLSLVQFTRLSDLLFAVAKSFGCYLSGLPTSTGVELKYVPRNQIVKNKIFLRDITQGKIRTSPVSVQSEKKTLVGYGSLFTADGIDIVSIDTADTVLQQSERYRAIPKQGEKLLFTTSTSVVKIMYKTQSDTFDYKLLQTTSLTVDLDTSELEFVMFFDYLSTAIYIQRTGNYSSGTATAWYPAANVFAPIANEQVKFDTLTDYVRYVFNQDEQYYSTEYELTVPYLNAFKNLLSDENGLWRNLQRGSQIDFSEDLNGTIVTYTYVVIGINRSLTRPETKIRLHLRSRYALNVPPPPPPGTGGDPEITTPVLFPKASDDSSVVKTGVVLCSERNLDNGYTGEEWNADGEQIGEWYHGEIEHNFNLINPEAFSLRLRGEIQTGVDSWSAALCRPFIEVVDENKLRVHVIRRNVNTLEPDNVVEGLGTWRFTYELVEERNFSFMQVEVSA